MSDKPKLAPEAYNIKFPKNTLVKLRVREASNERSKNGHRMHKITLEIIDNAPVAVDGKEIDINGLDIMTFSVMTEKTLPFANKIRQAFGFSDLTSEGEINDADAKDYIGQVCYALVESTEQERVNELTKEKVLDPYTGKVMVTYRREITEWIARPRE